MLDTDPSPWSLIPTFGPQPQFLAPTPTPGPRSLAPLRLRMAGPVLWAHGRTRCLGQPDALPRHRVVVVPL